MRWDVEAYPGVSHDLGILIATWQDGTREYREYLEEPPMEAIVWPIYPDGPSIGGVLLHIAECEAYWLQEFVDKEAPSSDDPAWAYGLELQQDVPFWPPAPAQPIQWYYDILDRQRAASIERIVRHGNAERELERREGMVTYRWILAHLVEHDSYHGGQAVLLHEAWKARRNSREVTGG